MNFSLLFPLIVTTIVAIASWYVVHRLSIDCDQRNKRRDLRIQYLIEAYRRLEGAAHRADLSAFAREVESALTDVQLFGTERQVQLAHEFAEAMARDRTAALDPLVANIRSELRSALRLEAVPDRIVVFRYFEPAK